MDVIKEINEKYQALESEVDTKLDAVKREEAKFQKTNAVCLEREQQQHTPKVLTYEDAMIRNANLLKSLEMTKARLRSRSTFSPVERILEKTLSNYKKDLLRTNESFSRNENIYDTVSAENRMQNEFFVSRY